jgi:hypothetical protein
MRVMYHSAHEVNQSSNVIEISYNCKVYTLEQPYKVPH